MTNQWHNTRITKKPYNRYNPSLRNVIPAVYKPWFIAVAIISLVLGIIIIGVSVGLKRFDGDIQTEFYQLWAGVPLIVYGVMAIICVLFPKKKLAVFFVLLSFVLVVITITGAFGSGYYFWKDGWRRARYSLSNDRCSVNNEVCTCKDIESSLLPTKIDSCDDMETMVRLIISEMLLSTLGFMISIVGLFVSFMSICCGPMMYFEEYDEQYDPDFSSGEHPVEFVRGTLSAGGNVNPAYGERPPPTAQYY